MGAINYLTILALALLVRTSHQSDFGDLMNAKDKFNCISQCLEKLSYEDSDKEMTQGEVCKEFKDFKSCTGLCPDGATFVSSMAQIVPKSFKFLKESCEPGNEDKVVDPSFFKELEKESKDAEGMQQCVSECESHVQALLTGRVRNLDGVCRGWHKYSRCVKACPRGREAFKAAKKAFAKVFNMIESKCGSGSASTLAQSINKWILFGFSLSLVATLVH